MVYLWNVFGFYKESYIRKQVNSKVINYWNYFSYITCLEADENIWAFQMVRWTMFCIWVFKENEIAIMLRKHLKLPFWRKEVHLYRVTDQKWPLKMTFLGLEFIGMTVAWYSLGNKMLEENNLSTNSAVHIIRRWRWGEINECRHIQVLGKVFVDRG